MDTPVLQSVVRTSVLWQGNKLLFFGGFDYHRHSSHPKVLSTFQQASKEFGINSGGSLWTTGTHPFHKKLEEEIGRFIGFDEVALFPSCFLANQTLIHHFIKNKYNIFYPNHSHPSLKPFASGKSYSYSDLDKLESSVEKTEKPLIIAESIINHGNKIAPINEMMRRIPHAHFLIDDAHGIGVIGKKGRGVCENYDLNKTNLLITGSMSKGIGIFGGFIAGAEQIIQKLKNTSPIYQGSSALPIPVCAGAIKSIQILKNEPEKISNLQRTAISFKESLITNDLKIPLSKTPVSALNITDNDLLKKLKENLLINGIFPSLIHYPGSPARGIFRFALSSVHSQEEVDRLFSVLVSTL
jgi:8-amino-7-oxononanoate synthase